MLYPAFEPSFRSLAISKQHNGAIIRREIAAGYGSNIFRRDLLVQGEQLVDCFRSTAQANVGRNSICNCGGAVHPQSEAVTDSRSCGIQLCLIDFLFSKPLEGIE